MVAASAALTIRARADQRAAPSQPAFRTGVDLVQVDVSVLDKERRPVQGLTATDFTIREDGKVRPVVAFSAVEIPARPLLAAAPWTRDIAPDVITNQVPREGRLIVILFDRTIRGADMPLARETARAIVDQMGPADLAAVVYTARGVPQNFTADRRLLLAAIASPFMPLSDADIGGTGGLAGLSSALDDPDQIGNPGACLCGVCSLDAMTGVADALRNVPERRKMLLFIGSRLPVQSGGNCSGLVSDARTRLFRAAGVANLAIHTFDSNALETLAVMADRGGASPPPSAGGNLQRQGDLAVYADRTGGRAISNTNAPRNLVAAIFSESRSYYILGFEPASSQTNGSFHDIKVSVARGDVAVHSRQGYYAPSAPSRNAAKQGGPPPSLVAALTGLWPKTAVPLGVTAAAFANPGQGQPVVSVVVHARESLGVDGAARPQIGDRIGPQRINVLAGAYDRTDKSVDYHLQTIELTPPSSAQTTLDYEVPSRLTLKPGRYEIRVATENVTRGTSGSVYTYVDVPDFAKAALSLSGVVLGTTGGARTSAGPLGDLLPFTPTARREFRTQERVTAFVRVYRSGSGNATPVSLSTVVVDDRNLLIFEQRIPAFDAGAGGRRSADHQVELPLADLKPGGYLLTIGVGGQNADLRRDVRFAVR